MVKIKRGGAELPRDLDLAACPGHPSVRRELAQRLTLYGQAQPRSRQRSRTPLGVDRDEREDAYGDPDRFADPISQGPGFELDGHRGSTALDDLRVNAKHVSNMNRLDELHGIYRYRRYPPIRALTGCDSCGQVHL